MKTLYFNNFEELACAISDKYDEINEEDYSSVDVIAKYDEMKEILTNLICIGHPIVFITGLESPNDDGYDKEFVLSINNKGLWVEPMYREQSQYNEAGYITLKSTVVYVLDNCNSKVIPRIKSRIAYEVEVADDIEDCECKNHYDCCDCYECEYLDECCEYLDELREQNIDNEEETDTSCDKDGLKVTVKCDLDADEALAIIRDMESRIVHINEMFT